LNALVQIPRAGGPTQQLVSMTHAIFGLDAAPNGDLFVDQGSRGMQVVLAESDGSRPETIFTSGNDVGAPSIAMPDGRLLFTVRNGGRSSLAVAKRYETPTPFIQTTEETTGPVTMIGPSQVGFLIGSGKRRQVAVASAADGRILRRLEKVD